LHSCKTQLLYFQAIPHSLQKTWGWGALLPARSALRGGGPYKSKGKDGALKGRRYKNGTMYGVPTQTRAKSTAKNGCATDFFRSPLKGRTFFEAKSSDRGGHFFTLPLRQ
jgi:hypothetical protein